MSPQELFDHATVVLHHCDATGVEPEKAAVFLETMRDSLLSVHRWLPPVLGSEGYGDGHLTDLLRQSKFQSESLVRDFPKGIDHFTASLVLLRQYLQHHYPITAPDSIHSEQRRVQSA